MQEIKKIGVWSTAKIFLLFGILLGLLMGIYSSLAIPAIINNNPDLAAQLGDQISSGFSIKIFITVLIVYTILMFLAGILGALLYNGFAKIVGGIKIELKTK